MNRNKKRKKKKTPKKSKTKTTKDGLSLNELKEALGADKVEVVPNRNAAIEARLLALLSGKAAPPNEFVGYLVKKAQDTRTEFEVTAANVQELTIRLNQMKQRALVLQTEYNKYLEDIQEWDKPKGPGKNQARKEK